MRRVVIFSLLLFPLALLAQTKTDQERIKTHIYTLADDSMQGRKAGSQDAFRAALYISSHFSEIGLKPVNDTTFFKNFKKSVIGGELPMNNVVGMIEGSDPLLKDQYIVLGAHYDHLGTNSSEGDNIYNGADDNASGVAALIELARNLKREEGTLKRSVVFVAFDGEEMGLYGSHEFVESQTIPIEQILLMVSMDMIGYYHKSGFVEYVGTGTLTGAGEFIKEISQGSGLNVKTSRFEKGIFSATDTQPFAQAGVPTFYITTGMKSPYHKPQDEADGIDCEGLSAITDNITSVVKYIAVNESVKPSGKIADIHKNKKFSFKPGISAGLGSSKLEYTSGPVTGKSSLDYNFGASMAFRFSYFEIKPEAYYEVMSLPVHDIYVNTPNASTFMNLKAITVPLSFGTYILKPNESPLTIGYSLKVYYRRYLSGNYGDYEMDFNNTYNRDELGLGMGLNFILGHVTLSIENLYSKTNLVKDLTPNYLPETFILRLGYEF